MTTQRSRSQNHQQLDDRRIGGIWPTAEQVRLLRVALAETPDEAAAALAAWKPHLQIDQLDLGSQRLLSLCYLNLQRHHIDDALLPRLEEFYIRARDRNHMIFAAVATLLQQLHDAGIRAMLFKGAAMITNYYGDDGARYMDDCDMLVPTRQAAHAIVTMRKLGWQTDRWMPAELTDEFFNTRHGASFTPDKRVYVDIHWHALAERYWVGVDDAFWEAAQAIRWQGAPSYMFNPADSLLISCVHGTHWQPFPALRWVADAVTILRKVEIDWRRLEQQTERLRFARTMHAALSYLRDSFGMAIPDSTLDRLQSMKMPWWAEQEHRLRTQRGQPWWHPFKMLIHHVRREPERTFFGHVCAFPDTLAYLRIPQLLRGQLSARIKGRKLD
jgi:hypothetical protein